MTGDCTGRLPSTSGRSRGSRTSPSRRWWPATPIARRSPSTARPRPTDRARVTTAGPVATTPTASPASGISSSPPRSTADRRGRPRTSPPAIRSSGGPSAAAEPAATCSTSSTPRSTRKVACSWAGTTGASVAAWTGRRTRSPPRRRSRASRAASGCSRPTIPSSRRWLRLRGRAGSWRARPPSCRGPRPTTEARPSPPTRCTAASARRTPSSSSRRSVPPTTPTR